jgi:hypothetical protein
MVFDPGDPSHIAVSTTFGLLESRDLARSFTWTCESALGIQGQQDTMIAITASGATVATTFDGMAVSRDGCSFQFPAELAGKIVPDLALSRSAPHELVAFHMMGVGNAQYDSQIVGSTDDGRSWTNVGPPLPIDLLPLSIDIAPTDRSRVYFSGRLGTAGAYASVLMRSVDGGATFERIVVPETDVNRLAYIAAVHPFDPDRVYVRVDDTAGTVIWSSEDGGRSLRKRFTGAARLLGFAMSTDGARIALGGPDDGTWVGPTEGTSFERRSDVGPTCLAWTTDGLYACADAQKSGFSLGISHDEAATFEPLLQFASLCSRMACGADTDVGRLCPAAWELVSPAFGASCHDADAGAALRDAALPTSAPSSSGCALVPAPPRAGGWFAASLAALLLRRRTRSSRRRFRSRVTGLVVYACEMDRRDGRQAPAGPRRG